MDFDEEDSSSGGSTNEQPANQMRPMPRRQPDRNQQKPQLLFFREPFFESEQGGGLQLLTQQSEQIIQNQKLTKNNVPPQVNTTINHLHAQEEQKHHQLINRTRLQNVPSQLIQNRQLNAFVDQSLNQMRNQKYPIQKSQDLKIEISPMISKQPGKDESRNQHLNEFFPENRQNNDHNQLLDSHQLVRNERLQLQGNTIVQQRDQLLADNKKQQPQFEAYKVVVMQNQHHDQSDSEDDNRCECQFCGNMVFIVDLDAHEQGCQVIQSEKEVARIQQQQNRQAFGAGMQPHQILNQQQPNLMQIHSESFGANDAESENVPRFTKTTHPSGVVPIPRPFKNRVNLIQSDEEFDHSGGNANEGLPQSRSGEIQQRNIFQYSSNWQRQRHAQGHENSQNQEQFRSLVIAPTTFVVQRQNQNNLFDVGADFEGRYQPAQQITQTTFQVNQPNRQSMSQIFQEQQMPVNRRNYIRGPQNSIGDYRISGEQSSSEQEADEDQEDEIQQISQNTNQNFESASDSALLRRIAMWRQHMHMGQLDNEEEMQNDEQQYGDEEDEVEGGIQLYPNDSDEDINPVHPELLAALPVNQFTQANILNFSEENKLCTICQSNYEVGEEYMMLMCLHRFHQACVGQWFQTKDTCPICKQQVNVQQQLHQSQQESREQMMVQQQHTVTSEIQINRMFAHMQIEDEDELDSQHQQQSQWPNSFNQRRQNDFEGYEQLNSIREIMIGREQALRSVRQILQADEDEISFESRVQDLNHNIAAQPERRINVNQRPSNRGQIQIALHQQQQRRHYERSAFDSSSDEDQ